MLTGTATWLKQSVTIESWTGNNGDSNTYGAGAAKACRIVQKSTKQMTDKGEVVVQSTIIILDGSVTITAKDRITLPDGTKPLILAVNSIPGPDGTPYLKEVLT